MGPLVDWAWPLKEGWTAVEGQDLTGLADPAALAVLLFYPLAALWLGYRWGARSRRRRSVSSGRLFIGVLRLVGIVVTLGLGLLIAVARTAGRSTFHSGARF